MLTVNGHGDGTRQGASCAMLTPFSLSHSEALMATPTLAIVLTPHAFNATLAYLAAQWTQDGSVTVTQYPMRKVAQMSGIELAGSL